MRRTNQPPCNRWPDRTGGVSRSVSALLCLLAGLTAGCGAETYEQRLNETARYFEYRQRVDEALERNPWREYGVEFRPLKGFQELPRSAEPGARDERQPPFLPQPLPGLLAAWRGQVRVDSPDLESGTLPAWLLLCTNHQRHLDRTLNPNVFPGELHNDVSHALADVLGYKRHSALDPWGFAEVRAPRGTPWVPRKTYAWIPLEGEVPIDGHHVRMEFRQYQYNVGEIQLSLVTVFPHAEILDPRERIDAKLEIAMETLRMTGDVPRPQGTAPVSGGGF